VVVAGLAGIAGVALVLYLFFLAWAGAARDRIDAARLVLLPALDPLSDRIPPGASPAEWAEALDSSRTMLAEIAGTGRLDAREAASLRADLDERVARSTPETAARELSALWDDLERLKGRWRSKLALRRPPLLTREPPR
jgi:hypothetical protein